MTGLGTSVASPFDDLPATTQEAALPLGFTVGAATAGIKPSGRPDLAVVLVTAEEPAAAAGVFTTNRMAAAPVRISRQHLAASGGLARAIVVTSGCANAATGRAGEADEQQVVETLAAALACPPAQILAGSTGLIGTRLPVDRIEPALRDLVATGLSTDGAGLAAAANAIMTTDRQPKAATTTIVLPADDGQARQVRVSGIAKGVGMIHPAMATLIAVVLTDAAVRPADLGALLASAADATFNQLSVDADTSTNDTVLVLASGASGAAPVRHGSPEAADLGAALTAVCRSLARQQAADGEGATTLITCRVTGAVDLIDARTAARAVVASNLVKAAVHGRDPNWGRVASAAGAARRLDGRAVELDPERLAISLAGASVFAAGGPVAFDRSVVSMAMAGPEVEVGLDLGLGEAAAEAWGCDLTEAYVRENAEYST
ncbi:MAG TPA: bifunctional glutamate N-acetyltransferase/amino-acid acetyltransferase ArgJ [Candidatus Limnocylindrales bacterium]|nr:bifunctional glutamate N-acetyltransferase/amino-acid acetyltransferase ArgJ [Candidatus Limnocylindrales bacterium]